MTPLINLEKIQNVLCIGAHPDDIEIGAGGTLRRLLETNPGLTLHWVVFCAGDLTRAEEANSSAAAFSEQIELTLYTFKDAFLPWQGEQIKTVFEDLKQAHCPDLIFTHYSEDKHQDHRLLSEFTWNTWRNHAILEYEILKWDGDLGKPNTYVPLSEEISGQKARHIYQSFASQQSKPWFTEENCLALMRVRGVECHAPFAEAFYARKLVW